MTNFSRSSQVAYVGVCAGPCHVLPSHEDLGCQVHTKPHEKFLKQCAPDQLECTDVVCLGTLIQHTHTHTTNVTQAYLIAHTYNRHQTIHQLTISIDRETEVTFLN